jgi:CBS domain-containing protein
LFINVPSKETLVKAKSMTAKDMCKHDVVAAERETPLTVCAKLMRDEHVGSLVVTVAKNGQQIPVGILTDRDITVAAVAFSLDPDAITAGDIMTQPLITARPDEDQMSVLARMKKNGVRRIPVVAKDETLIGILAADDVWETLAGELDSLVRVMRTEQRKEQRSRPASRAAHPS